jgi:hypothetical protein
VRYWDASALVPLAFDEPTTERARELLSSDPVVVTWAMTRIEIVSAVERNARGGSFDAAQRRSILDAFDGFAETWQEITDVVAVRRRAAALLARHPLRAADAAQLGSALLLAEDDPSAVEFVCMDRRLAEAATREGFRVLGVR